MRQLGLWEPQAGLGPGDGCQDQDSTREDDPRGGLGRKNGCQGNSFGYKPWQSTAAPSAGTALRPALPICQALQRVCSLLGASETVCELRAGSMAEARAILKV